MKLETLTNISLFFSGLGFFFLVTKYSIVNLTGFVTTFFAIYLISLGILKLGRQNEKREDNQVNSN